MSALPPAKIQEKEKFSPASKFIELVEYDAEAHTLDLTFKSGSKHRYLMFFPSTFLSFKSSPTHDAFYSRLIRGKFPAAELVSASIGQKKSTPLNKVKKEHKLDEGLRKHIAERDRIAGTVARAIKAAAIG